MQTFKIQGQLLYAVIDSLLPSSHEEPTFLQIYIMENEELERRLSACPYTNTEMLFYVQELLHCVNPYIQDFKTVFKTLPHILQSYH